MLYPLKFQPIFKSYLWGGRNLERLFGKRIPPTGPVAESWEIVDRAQDNSVVANGPLAGRTLRWLMEHFPVELTGRPASASARFPLLVKILDARDRLSLQVHPRPETAAMLGGEPKAELWHVVEARPGAFIYVGLKRGVTRQQFASAIAAGTVEALLHRLTLRDGDSMFLHSGRVHAIGSDCVLFEIQENSDTTYRVFDWGRRGVDGLARPLHVREAMSSIDFNDHEPALIAPRGERLASSPWFTADRFCVTTPRTDQCDGGTFHIVCATRGRGRLTWNSSEMAVAAGDSLLLPAALGQYQLAGDPALDMLKVFVLVSGE